MDIREILKALDNEDKNLFDDCRSNIRKAYLTAHNKSLGVGNWSPEDDAFLDMVDIKIATLFDRSGSFNTTKNIIGKEDVAKIENDLHKKDDDIKNKLALVEPKPVAEVPKNEWK